MGLFREENFKVVVSPELKLVKEFAKLIKRDRSKDHNRSTKELAYIYFVEDDKSPYSMYSENERGMRVIESLGLINWTEDKEVKQAREVYKELSQTPTIMALKTLKEGLMTSSNVINAVTVDINNKISNLDADDEDYEDIIDSLTKRVEKLISLSDKLPKAVESLTMLEDKAKKEVKGDSKIRGGGAIGQFET
jgi:hypothetical protein